MVHYPQTPTPRHFWHTLETTASAEDIWNVWTNVNEWHRWDKGLRSASLQGTFQKDTRGTLVGTNGTSSPFSITEYVEGVTYTFSTSLPFARLHIKRFLDKQKAGTVQFTHEVWFDGLLSGLFALLLGKNFMRILPSVMEEVRRIAERSTESSTHSTAST